MKNFEKYIDKIAEQTDGFECTKCPALDDCNSGNDDCEIAFKKWALKEVKDESQWRPFKDTDELIAEFCKRFNIKKTNWGLPSIWVKQKGYDNEELVTDLCGTTVKLGIILIRLDNFFEDYTFLDGSPCGVLEEVEDD